MVLSAKRILFDSVKDIVTAEGNVVVTQSLPSGKSKVLHTDKIEYDRNKRTIFIPGKAIMRDERGGELSISEIELDDNFKNATIKAFHLILEDKSWLKAAYGIKENDKYTLKDARYSPCIENNCSIALWDISAESIVYDTKEKVFIYKNAKLRIKGYPILYTPYFSHPSFDVKRKSGFITPVISSNNDTGFIASVPYYIVISKDKDMTIKPFLNFRKRAMCAIEYRQAFRNGDFKIDGSFLSKSNRDITLPQERKNRWHLGLFYKTVNLQNKRVIIDINRASDITYLLRYPINNRYSGSLLQPKNNQSKLIFDSFGDNYYAEVAAHAFQTDDNKTVPIVMPLLSCNYQRPGAGGVISFDTQNLALTRKKHTPLLPKRLLKTSNKVSYFYNSQLNNVVINFSTTGRCDLYHYKQENGAIDSTKIFPITENQVAVSYPMRTKIATEQITIINPMVSLSSVIASSKKNKLFINEDSIFDRFSDLNILCANRCLGRDRIEIGEKFTPGIEMSLFNSKRRWLDVFIGKCNFIKKRSHPYMKNDFVGRIILKPVEFFSLRMNCLGLAPLKKAQSCDFGTSIEFKNFNFDLDYSYDNTKNFIRNKKTSQLGLNIGYKFNKHWKIDASSVFMLSPKTMLSRCVFIKYEDECFEMLFGIYKAQYRVNDIKPRRGFLFSIVFRNVADISQAVKNYVYSPTFGKIS